MRVEGLTRSRAVRIGLDLGLSDIDEEVGEDQEGYYKLEHVSWSQHTPGLVLEDVSWYQHHDTCYWLLSVKRYQHTPISVLA